MTPRREGTNLRNYREVSMKVILFIVLLLVALWVLFKFVLPAMRHR
jgi:hypothetical protein